MECDICGSKEGLVKVKNEDGEMIDLCSACYGTQYEGYEASDESDFSDDDSFDDGEADGESDSDDKDELDQDDDFDDDDEED